MALHMHLQRHRLKLIKMLLRRLDCFFPQLRRRHVLVKGCYLRRVRLSYGSGFWRIGFFVCFVFAFCFVLFFLFSCGVVLQRKSTDIEAKQIEPWMKVAVWTPFTCPLLDFHGPSPKAPWNTVENQ